MTRNIQKQKTLSRDERVQNVAGAFTVPPTVSLAGTRVIVFDDIVTTGATLEEAARALARAGATVTALAIARA